MKLIMTAVLLYLLLLPETFCALRILPQFYYNSEVCMIGGSFITFRKVTATQCVYECYVHSRCVYLSYHWIMHGCFLHDKENRDSSENEVALSGCLNLHESEINEIGLTVAGKCKERPCSRSKAVFECNTGYYNISALETTCNANSEWADLANLRCLKHCSNPPNLDRFKVRTDEEPYTIYSMTSYRCIAGYYMYPIGSRESVIRWQDNGAWSKPTEKCYKYCGSYPLVIQWTML